MTRSTAPNSRPAAHSAAHSATGPAPRRRIRPARPALRLAAQAAAALLGALALALPAPQAARAQDMPRIEAELRPGWRMDDGSHMAALELRLPPGWKTYWRAPGDAGIPPRFDWRATTGPALVQPIWPAPRIFDQQGMRAIGYEDRLVLPLRVEAGAGGALPDRLAGTVDLGVCRDVCLPVRLEVATALPAQHTPDPAIAAALAARPYSAAQAGVRRLRCEIAAIPGGLALTAHLQLPPVGGPEAAVVETGSPDHWVSVPKMQRRGNELTIRAEVRHAEDGAVALDRSALRLTVLGDGAAVDIRGCPAG